jgi:hypothetical protein
MLSLPFRAALMRLAGISMVPWLFAVVVQAQTTPSAAAPLPPEQGLVTDYWVRLTISVVLLLIFVSYSLYALEKFQEAMSDPNKGGLWMESHWGGLGGGLGGWRVSNAFVYLVVFAFFGGLAIAAISMAPPYPGTTPKEPKEEAPAATSSTDSTKEPEHESSVDTSRGAETNNDDEATEKDANEKK